MLPRELKLLYQILCRHGFIHVCIIIIMTLKTIHEYLGYNLLQVRGPLGSGNTTLARLLHQYIQKNEPGYIF